MKRPWLKPLLTPWTRRAATGVFIASFFLPVTGLGVDLCPVHAATGLPCPGCGVTRALAMASQGDWLTASGAHPAIFVLWPGLLVLAVAGLLPSRVVTSAEAKLDVLEPAFSRAWAVFIAAFFGFGFLRLLTFLVLGERFP